MMTTKPILQFPGFRICLGENYIMTKSDSTVNHSFSFLPLLTSLDKSVCETPVQLPAVFILAKGLKLRFFRHCTRANRISLPRVP